MGVSEGGGVRVGVGGVAGVGVGVGVGVGEGEGVGKNVGVVASVGVGVAIGVGNAVRVGVTGWAVSSSPVQDAISSARTAAVDSISRALLFRILLVKFGHVGDCPH